MAIYPSIWIGPYLQIGAKPEEVREDMCRRKYECVNPDPKNGRYCPGCGLDIGGMYVEPDGRCEGRYSYKLRVVKDARQIIAGMKGCDVDLFAPGCDLRPEFDPDEKRFIDDGLKRFTIHPNRGDWGSVFQNRHDETFDLTNIDIPETLARFEEHFKPIIERLRSEFDEVVVKFGMVMTWS